MSVVNNCPGSYCGPTYLENGLWGRGGGRRVYRSNETSYYMTCTDEPTSFDWQYLGFMVCLPLVLHWYCIDKAQFLNGKWIKLIQHMCAFLEIATGTVLALLMLPPANTLTLYVGPLKTLSEWYRLKEIFFYYYQRPDHDKKLHCIQEPEYPMYTLIHLNYTISFILTITLRPLILNCLGVRSGMKAIYNAMFFYPVLVLTHTVAAGILHCFYSFILIIISIHTSGFILINDPFQSPTPLWASLTNTRTLILLIGNWLILAYGLMVLSGLIGLSGFEKLWILSAVPVPTLVHYLLNQIIQLLAEGNDWELFLDLERHSFERERLYEV